MSEPYQERAGTPIHGKSATVTLDNGVRFNVAAEHADQFGGFLNELIARGAPITEAGGFGHRPRNASAHPGGHAVDVNQQSRNVISKPLAEWWDQNQDAVSEAERRWEMTGGEHWRNPDRGHFSVHRPLGSDEMEAARRSSQESIAGRSPMPLSDRRETSSKPEPQEQPYTGQQVLEDPRESAIRSPAAARPSAPEREAVVEKPTSAPKQEAKPEPAPEPKPEPKPEVPAGAETGPEGRST